MTHSFGITTGVPAIYNRHTYMDEMRAAIDAWEAKLTQLLKQHPAQT